MHLKGPWLPVIQPPEVEVRIDRHSQPEAVTISTYLHITNGVVERGEARIELRDCRDLEKVRDTVRAAFCDALVGILVRYIQAIRSGNPPALVPVDDKKPIRRSQEIG